MSHSYEILLALGVLSPFVSFWLLVFFGPRLGKPLAGWIGVVLGMGVPLIMASIVLWGWLGEVESGNAAKLTAEAFRYHWADLGSVPITVGVKLDSLTVAMYFMVTFIAFWIFVFSVGYMSGHSDEVGHRSKYHRFFAYLSLFGFSMLGLVISSSLLFLFIFWELVGLCSYLLIGFYFDREYASRAAMKAFITNRVGDFGFLIGLMLVFFQLGTLDLDQAALRFAEQYTNHTGIFESSFTIFGWSLATIMGVGLFCGAMGKSAQFPLHVWLPDAMAGPTPVSALIHAATMVAAGVYLVARVYRLMTPEALMFIATIGCLTLFLMALIAIVQTDIKKCLAYSTLSQLGYMIFGLGCGAWIAALFHLITHAFFKAMMFLGSGQVIEGCHHEQDMRKMGGLIKKMPVTGFTFLIGVLAIAGFGLPGVQIGSVKLGLGGFFSKDEILAVAWTRAFDWSDVHRHESDHGGHDAHSESDAAEPNVMLASAKVDAPPHSAADRDSKEPPKATRIFGNTPSLPKWMFYLALATAYVTPFYMMRAWWMTFMGKPRDEHVYHHAHESPLMFVPLIVLAGGTFVSSYFLFRPLIAQAAPVATNAVAVLAINGENHTPAIHAAHQWLAWGVGGAFVVGFAIAIVLYRKGLEAAESIRRVPIVNAVHIVLEHKYFIDELYDFLWVKGCLAVSKIARFVDTHLVDRIFDTLAYSTERLAAFSGLILDNQGVDGIVNGVAKTSMDVAGIVRTPQTGRIRNYVLFAAGATTAVVIVLMIVFGTGSGEAVAFHGSNAP
ncbi:MAG: NADH-quinone oxidoreductase subunit L [Planctomycetota bacterium]